jgi:hypothetical protein
MQVDLPSLPSCEVAASQDFFVFAPDRFKSAPTVSLVQVDCQALNPKSAETFQQVPDPQIVNSDTTRFCGNVLFLVSLQKYFCPRTRCENDEVSPIHARSSDMISYSAQSPSVCVPSELCLNGSASELNLSIDWNDSRLASVIGKTRPNLSDVREEWVDRTRFGRRVFPAQTRSNFLRCSGQAIFDFSGNQFGTIPPMLGFATLVDQQCLSSVPRERP